MQADIVIRPMLEGDIDAVLRVTSVSLKSVWPREAFERELRHGGTCYLVAERSGEILGYIGSWMMFGDLQVTLFAVDPHYRQQKIGLRLFYEMMREGLSRDCVNATLEVRPTALPAVSLYEKFGFKTVHTRKKYYDDGEDALLMQAADLNSGAYRDKLEKIGSEYGIG